MISMCFIFIRKWCDKSTTEWLDPLLSKITGSDPLVTHNEASSLVERYLKSRLSRLARMIVETSPLELLALPPSSSTIPTNRTKPLLTLRHKRLLETAKAFTNQIHQNRKALVFAQYPIRREVHWDWTGQVVGVNHKLRVRGTQATNVYRQCRLTVQGSDVFKGIQALIDSGIWELPLPDYVRDAPELGCYIRIVNGIVDF
jgi:hypothetical protein